jgi:hypothetical protein
MQAFPGGCGAACLPTGRPMLRLKEYRCSETAFAPESDRLAGANSEGAWPARPGRGRLSRRQPADRDTPGQARGAASTCGRWSQRANSNRRPADYELDSPGLHRRPGAYTGQGFGAALDSTGAGASNSETCRQRTCTPGGSERHRAGGSGSSERRLHGAREKTRGERDGGKNRGRTVSCETSRVLRIALKTYQEERRHVARTWNPDRRRLD